MKLSALFKSLTKTTDEIHRPLIKENYYVAGTAYQEENIRKLACCNPDWKATTAQLQERKQLGKKIYRYTYVYKPVKLIPEKNPHDKNAVMVFIAGEKVGYIPATDSAHVRKILEKSDIKYVSAYIHGGEYKVVSSSGDRQKLSEDIRISIQIAYV